VLAYLFPKEAPALAGKANEAGRSRLLAGVAYPSDVQAGQELGRKMAAAVIEHAKHDGSDVVWNGTMPTGPGYWTGTNPRLVTMGTWKPWVLASPEQFRPAPPPAYDSPQRAAELAEVRNVELTFERKRTAFFWNAPEIKEWLAILNLKSFEYRLDDNPPRASRAMALLMVAAFDSFISCFEAKHHYWVARPFQLDPTITPLLPTPNHPSYPSAHGCDAAAAAAVLAYLFPREAAFFEERAREAAESRLWAGIHFRSDLEAGLKLGEAVGQLVVERARQDDRGR
jgi:membrane-associated phospholipid phosphatase